MWAAHHHDQCPDLDAHEEPTDAGRRLDAGGLILADPFETILRPLSVSYLCTAWDHMSDTSWYRRLHCRLSTHTLQTEVDSHILPLASLHIL
jgi:hypothetical protein